MDCQVKSSETSCLKRYTAPVIEQMQALETVSKQTHTLWNKKFVQKPSQEDTAHANLPHFRESQTPYHLQRYAEHVEVADSAKDPLGHGEV